MEKEMALVLGYLDKVAAKVGVGVGELFPYFVRQQYVDGAVAFFLFVFFSIATLVVCFSEKKFWDWDREEPTRYLWVFSVLLFAAAVSGVYMVGETPDIFNPTYWAVRDIARLIK